MNDIVYSETTHKPNAHRHIISAMVENETGVLARVIALFAARGYNIESLTVAEVDAKERVSRITVVTTGDDMIIGQIKAQLERLIPVHSVYDLTMECKYVERELALIKVRSSGAKRVEALRIADIFRARVVDITTQSFIFEITGECEKIDTFIEMMRPLGLINIARTGVVAVSRGPSNLRDKKKFTSS
ncbi:MAG: acetolactate synthase small subunit [Alphaproteobacteria bacterium]|nr:acetolactate synthase small subunit [Alphaproteobacteria bacterium]